ncbi:MAG: hypothetical protein LUE26_01450 [Alistipes sp.]|nr:hypothetical protein [Alistipes sp.]
MRKLAIIGYSDEKFSKEAGRFTAQINPAGVKFNKGLEYTGGDKVNVTVPSKKFEKMKATTMSFEFILDGTGVIPESRPVDNAVADFEKTAYSVNNEIHRPNFLIVSWGSFVFKGQMTTADYEYTLFRGDGTPLRVKISLSVEGYMDPVTEAAEVDRRSPDLTRRIRLTGGENLATLCHRFYGDAAYCADVARVNGLPGFRDIEPGTELLFPPLGRNG